jgi:hypothetical protein
MKVVFIGNPRDPADNKGSITMFGLTFPLNIPVDVSGSAPFAGKLRGNREFRVLDEDPAQDAEPEEALAEAMKAEGKPSRAELIALAAERGVKIDKRWNDERIAAAIEGA